MQSTAKRAAAAQSAPAPSAIDSLRRLVAALRVSSHASLRELGLSGAQVFVLQQLAGERPLSLGELAARTHTDPSSVSVVVARLVRRRLVVRRAAAEDARRAELRLSASGRALLERAPVPVQVRLIEALEALPRREREALAGTLAGLVERLGLADESAAMFFEDRPAARGAGARPAGARRPRAS